MDTIARIPAIGYDEDAKWPCAQSDVPGGWNGSPQEESGFSNSV